MDGLEITQEIILENIDRQTKIVDKMEKEYEDRVGIINDKINGLVKDVHVMKYNLGKERAMLQLYNNDKAAIEIKIKETEDKVDKKDDRNNKGL